MVTALLAFLAMGGPAPPAGRYEMGERLKVVDRLWVSTPDRSRRANAVPKISKAVSLFLSGTYPEACRNLDEAGAALRGDDSVPEDAISLRFHPPYADPRSPATLHIGWAYLPVSAKPIRITVGKQSLIATPGRQLTMLVRPEVLNAELSVDPEAGYYVPVQVGARSRGAYLSIVKRVRERVGALLTSTDPEAKTLAQALLAQISNTAQAETDFPIIQSLFTAEQLDEKRLRLDRAESLPYVKHGETVFRVAFPKRLLGASAKTLVTVVVALHGQGGSENMFFEAYGGGMAVTEALRRGWVFVSPRANAHAVADCLDWLRKRRGLNITRLYVMGHSLGGGLALGTGELTPKPRALALFAPAAAAIPQSMGDIPIYVALGKQDSLLGASVRSLAAGVSGRADCQFEEFDPCEHLMIVADALPSAYRFFDAH